MSVFGHEEWLRFLATPSSPSRQAQQQGPSRGGQEATQRHQGEKTAGYASRATSKEASAFRSASAKPENAWPLVPPSLGLAPKLGFVVFIFIGLHKVFGRLRSRTLALPVHVFFPFQGHLDAGPVL